MPRHDSADFEILNTLTISDDTGETWCMRLHESLLPYLVLQYHGFHHFWASANGRGYHEEGISKGKGRRRSDDYYSKQNKQSCLMQESIKNNTNYASMFCKICGRKVCALHTIAGNWWICWWNVPCCNEGKGKSWLLLPCLFLSHG